MMRASKISVICTNRSTYKESDLSDVQKELETKALAKKTSYDYTQKDALRLMEVAGLKTIANTVLTQFEKAALAEIDPLPEGAKTHLQEVWLENNYGFKDFSLKENAPQLQKGHLCEDGAILDLGKLFNKSYTKNTKRITKGFLTGECDIDFGPNVIDIKCPETWKSFRNKYGIPTEYYWQLIAYCYLYDKKFASLAYVLMPTPNSLWKAFTKGFSQKEIEDFTKQEETIISLSPGDRIKTFSIDETNINADIKFMLSRLDKAEEYYNSLDYKTCMRW